MLAQLFRRPISPLISFCSLGVSLRRQHVSESVRFSGRITRRARMGREVPLLCRSLSKRSSGVIFSLSVLWKLVEDGRVLDAYKVVMVGANKLPKMDVFDYSFLIHRLCRYGYIREALNVCVYARSQSVALNIVTYNSVIDGLCRQGCLVEAFRLFDSLERIGLVPSVITYGTLIDNLSKRGFLLDARQFFDKMICRGCKPTTRIYNSLIDNYCKNSQMDEALRLISEMELNDLKPDEFTVSVMISGYCQKGNMEGALDFFSELKGKGVSPDFLGFTHLIRGLCTKGRLEEARCILREMLRSERVVELINSIHSDNESESVEDFLVFLCEQGNIHEAMVVLNEIASILLPVRSLSVSFPGSQARSEYSESEALPAVAFGTTESNLSDCNHESQYMKKIAELVESHDSAGKDPKVRDFGSYYSQISSLCSKGDILKANELVDELLSNLQ